MAESPSGPEPTEPPSPKKSPGVLKHYIGIALLLVVLAGVAIWGVRTCQAMLNEQVAGVAKVFQDVLSVRPEIRVNSTVVYGQTSAIEELAVVKKEQLVEMTLKQNMQIWSTPIPMTGKELHVRAIYRIKAGFDLSKPFVVDIDPTTNQITAHLPPAEILSVEQVGPLTMKEEAGWLARITTEEREQLLNQLHQAAEAAAQDSGLIEQAQQEVTRRLEDLAKRNGQDLNVQLRKTE